MSWLETYRQSLRDGSSQHVIRKARWVMGGVTLLWVIGLTAIAKVGLPGGTGMQTLVVYFALLLAGYVVFCLVKLLFAPNRR